MMKDAENTEGTVSSTALKLAEQIRQTGRRSPQDFLPLIEQADRLAATTTDLAVTAGASGYLLKDSLDSQERPTDLPGLSRGLEQPDSGVVALEGVSGASKGITRHGIAWSDSHDPQRWLRFLS